MKTNRGKVSISAADGKPGFENDNPPADFIDQQADAECAAQPEPMPSPDPQPARPQATKPQKAAASLGSHVHLEAAAITAARRCIASMMDYGPKGPLDLSPEIMPTAELVTACAVARGAWQAGRRGWAEAIGHAMDNTGSQAEQDAIRATIADTAQEFPERPETMERAAGIVLEYHAARQLQFIDWRIKVAIENGEDIAPLIAERAALKTAPASLIQAAYALRFDPDSQPPPDEILLNLGDVPIAASGNLTVVQGKSKVGKSAVVAAILAAAMRGRRALQGDMLAFEWAGDSDTGAIIHIDSEQSPADWHALVNRAVTRSGLPQADDRLVSLPLVQFSRGERMDIIRQSLEIEHQSRGVALVVLDGVADVCASPNDEAESLELVSRLLALCHRYGTAAVCILHENPGTDLGKTRGHLGSELNRKAFANLRIDKDESGVSTIHGQDMRRRDIPKAQGYCFAWDDAAGMHTYAGRAAGLQAAKRESEAAEKALGEWLPIFQQAAEIGTNGPCPDLSAEAAAKLERDISGTKKLTATDTMKKRMQRAEALGVLRKTKAGHWSLATAGQTGQERDKGDMS
jgi:hypothetical protein